MIRVVVFLSRLTASTRRAKDATLPQTKPRARLDDARDELDERLLGGVVFTPRVLLVRVPVLARARPSDRFVGARGTASARAFELDSVRARELAGRPRAPSGASRIVTAMSDAVARGDGDDGDAGPNRAAPTTRLQRVVDSFRKQSLKRAKRNLTKLPLALISLLVGFSVCALLPHRRVRGMPSYRSPSYSSPSLYPASCGAAITRAASYDGFATALVTDGVELFQNWGAIRFICDAFKVGS